MARLIYIWSLTFYITFMAILDTKKVCHAYLLLAKVSILVFIDSLKRAKYTNQTHASCISNILQAKQYYRKNDTCTWIQIEEVILPQILFYAMPYKNYQLHEKSPLWTINLSSGSSKHLRLSCLVTKPTKRLLSEDSDQPGHPPSLIRVFNVRMNKAWVLS